MPFGLSGLAGKLIGLAIVAAVIGGIILTQHLRINNLRADLAECRVGTVTLEKTNGDQADLILQLTDDKAVADKRAADAAVAHKKAEATAAKRIQAALKRLNDAATEQDRQPVSPALRGALGALK